MLIYSAGLRVGEMGKLKLEDIDSKRKLIHVSTQSIGRIKSPLDSLNLKSHNRTKSEVIRL